MNYPTIVFRKMTLKENIDFVKEAFYEHGESLSLHDYTLEAFPELKKYDLNSSKEEVFLALEKVVSDRYKKLNDVIENKVKACSKIWDEVNDKYFKLLTEFFEVEFPEKFKTIDASIGILPVCPRYLDSFSFSISIGVPDNVIVNLCAHETLHFAWFEKWKEIYPDTPREEFDSPYLCWQYSEMVTDPILNNEPFLSQFNFNEHGYNSFYDLYDNGELVMDKLRAIYSEHISIEEKIKKGYGYIKRYYSKSINTK